MLLSTVVSPEALIPVAMLPSTSALLVECIAIANTAVACARVMHVWFDMSGCFLNPFWLQHASQPLPGKPGIITSSLLS